MSAVDEGRRRNTDIGEKFSRLKRSDRHAPPALCPHTSVFREELAREDCTPTLGDKVSSIE